MGYTKVVRAGDYLEIWKYEKRLPIRRNNPRGERKRRNRLAPRRPDNIRRLAKNFRRLVGANLVTGDAPALITLTMLQILPLETSRGIFSEFLIRARHRFGKGLRIIAVSEFQKRGAVHFHCLIWGLPYDLACSGKWVKAGRYRGKKRYRFRHDCEEGALCERTTRSIQRLWQAGYCDAVKTDGSPKLAGYLAKYMQKALFDSRLRGEKSYSATRNVLRPMCVGSEAMDSELEEMLGVDNSPCNVHSFATQWLGRCNYQRFNLGAYEHSHTSTENPAIQRGSV